MDAPFRDDVDPALHVLKALQFPLFLVQADPNGRFRLIFDTGALAETPSHSSGPRPIDEVFAPRTCADLKALLHDALSNPGPRTGDLTVARRSTSATLRLTLSRIPDGAAGRPRVLGIAIAVDDLTSGAEAAFLENAQMRSEIAQMQTLGRLVAHDLRAPLANIVSLTGLVMEDFTDLGDGKAHMIRTCGEVAEASLSEISVCMDRFRAGGAIPTQREAFDLGDTCRHLVAIADPAGRLRIALPECRLRCDRMVLTLAIRNLLDNAVRYAASQIGIESAADPESGLVSVVISDDGPGFPAGADPIRLALSGTPRTDGRGIGLRSVVSLLRSRGGDLVAEAPQPEIGARLVVTLPGSAAETSSLRHSA